MIEKAFTYNQLDNKALFVDKSAKAILKKAFIEQISDYAQKLEKLKVQKIALLNEDVYQFCVLFFAILSCQKELVLLPNKTEGILEELSDSYDVVIDDDFVKNHLEKDSGQKIDTSNLAENLKKVASRLYIHLYTSGSTGTPVKVSKTLENLCNEAQALSQKFGVCEDSISYSTVLHSHMYGLMFQIIWPLLEERRIFKDTITYPEELLSLLESSQASIVVTSPAFLSRLDYVGKNTKSLQNTLCISAGNLLEDTIAGRLESMFSLYPYEVLGSTETGVVAWRVQQKEFIWQSFKGVSISQTDDKALCVQSDFFPAEKEVMGDKIALIDAKHFKLLGRVDRIVKIEGLRLSLNEFEMRMNKHPWIAQCYGLVIQKNRQYLACVIQLTEQGEKVLTKEGQRYCNNQLKKYLAAWYDGVLQPKSFRYVENITYNSQGKVTLHWLKSLFE
ncbi:class I adenylate-forming enzyme family protein [Fangia hongkongensis]|uniref:class I adenylate-forming enzyme family protein n=2 Tax=Fangia hongkongensis TaxID=270495 RepID=UPI00146AADA1|nr:class I adenylate-forming enzyme family protein [Fangia hongkongensis]